MHKKLTNVAAVLTSQVEEVTEAVAAVQLNTNRQDKSSGLHGGQRHGGSGGGRGAGLSKDQGQFPIFRS